MDVFSFLFSPPSALSIRVRNGENPVLRMLFIHFITDFLYDFLPPLGVGMQVAEGPARVCCKFGVFLNQAILGVIVNNRVS